MNTLHATSSAGRPIRSICIAVLLVLSPVVLAGDYSMDWFTIDGGGGTSTGSVYSVSGTIGQPDAATMSGGDYTLDSGYWGIIAALQTPGAPFLTLTRSGNSVIISWPSPSMGWTLHQNEDLATTSWLDFSGPVNDDGTNKSVIISPPTDNRFYRLKK